MNVVDQGLTDDQRAKLAELLQKRKDELQRALDDVDDAIKTLALKRRRRDP